MLLSALPRLTLMLYELGGSDKQETTRGKTEKLLKASQDFLDMAYQGAGNLNLAKMGIALRSEDYGRFTSGNAPVFRRYASPESALPWMGITLLQ
jgi:hypothetical protein